MAKIKLTKNELKKQKDQLKMFTRYLPTLQLKKQQLQVEIRAIELRSIEVLSNKRKLEEEFNSWIAVFSDSFKIPASFLKVVEVKVDKGNIAGVSIPVFKKAEFAISEYDLFTTPPWVDKALENLKLVIELDIENSVLQKQIELLKSELNTATQRVNLFEKVKIPESKENIKKISIYLGDQQTASVVRGKISKNRLVKAGDEQ